MSRRPKTLRLADLDGGAVAEDVCRAVLRHVNSALPLLTHLPPKLQPSVTCIPLYENVRLLVAFAQGGLEKKPGEARALLESVGQVYFGSAESPGIRPLGHQGTAIGLIYIAATARRALQEGRPVDVRGLAALGGVDESRVRALCGGKRPVLQRANTTRQRGSDITAATARAWLAGQGVPGFQKPSRGA